MTIKQKIKDYLKKGGWSKNIDGNWVMWSGNTGRSRNDRDANDLLNFLKRISDE